MTPLDDSLDESLYAAQEIAGVGSSGVAPVAAAALGLDLIARRAGGCDVDAGELGADDGSAGAVDGRGLAFRAGDGADEHRPAGPVALEGALERGDLSVLETAEAAEAREGLATGA